MSLYTVKAGDTLGKLAKRFDGDPALFTRIVKANAIANPDKPKVGQLLEIPDDAADTASAAPAAVTTPTNPFDALNEKRLSVLHPLLARQTVHEEILSFRANMRSEIPTDTY